MKHKVKKMATFFLLLFVSILFASFTGCDMPKESMISNEQSSDESLAESVMNENSEDSTCIDETVKPSNSSSNEQSEEVSIPDPTAMTDAEKKRFVSTFFDNVIIQKKDNSDGSYAFSFTNKGNVDGFIVLGVMYNLLDEQDPNYMNPDPAVQKINSEIFTVFVSANSEVTCLLDTDSVHSDTGFILLGAEYAGVYYDMTQES